MTPSVRSTVIWAGAGASFPGARAGAPRDIGPAGVVAIEQVLTSRIAVRLEADGDVQAFSRRAGSLIGGNLQQIRTLVAARFAPVTIPRLVPYALAGLGTTWQSERFTLRNASDPVPGAEFQQTTSRTSAAVLLGAGAVTTGQRFRLFGDVRWTRSMPSGSPTTDVSVIGGMVFPLG